MTTPNNATISKLSDSEQTVTPSEANIRGRQVMDKDGHDLGKVHDLLVDDREHKARFLLVQHRGFLGIGEKQSFMEMTPMIGRRVDLRATRWDPHPRSTPDAGRG